MSHILHIKADGRKTPIVTEQGRACIKCGEEKSWAEFHKDIHGFNQKTATCKACRNVKGRQVYKENPEVRRSGMKNRPDKLKRLYDVTYEQIVGVLAHQNGRCANVSCSKEISLDVKGPVKNRAVIDHNHTTGKFRALLCTPCNMMLGIIETKESLMLGLVNYISKYNT
jgi:hypothetical protein